MEKISVVVMVVFCLIGATFADGCKDFKGREVADGEMFQPGRDPCTRCDCRDGKVGMCMAANCRAADCPGKVVWDDEDCCKYTCVDEDE